MASYQITNLLEKVSAMKIPNFCRIIFVKSLEKSIILRIKRHPTNKDTVVMSLHDVESLHRQTFPFNYIFLLNLAFVVYVLRNDENFPFLRR